MDRERLVSVCETEEFLGWLDEKIPDSEVIVENGKLKLGIGNKNTKDSEKIIENEETNT